MKKLIGLIAILIIAATTICSAQGDIESFMKKGEQLMLDGNQEEALTNFKEAIKLSEGKETVDFMIFVNAGLCSNGLGDQKAAAEYYWKAIDLGLKDPKAYKMIYNASKSQKDYASMEKACLLCLEQFPETAGQLNGMIIYTYVMTKKYIDAVPYIQQELAKTPDDYKLNYYMAQASQKQKKIGEATKYYEKSVKANPEYYSSNANLGIIYYRTAEMQYNKVKNKYESLGDKATRTDYSNYRKGLDAPKALYIKSTPFLEKAYSLKARPEIKTALFNAYTRADKPELAAKYK